MVPEADIEAAERAVEAELKAQILQDYHHAFGRNFEGSAHDVRHISRHIFFQLQQKLQQERDLVHRPYLSAMAAYEQSAAKARSIGLPTLSQLREKELARDAYCAKYDTKACDTSEEVCWTTDDYKRNAGTALWMQGSLKNGCFR